MELRRVEKEEEEARQGGRGVEGTQGERKAGEMVDEGR